MQLKSSFVLLATLASAGNISALPLGGDIGASERQMGDIDTRGSDVGADRAVSMGFDRQAREFYEELDARDALEELQTREFYDLEIRELNSLEELEARGQHKVPEISVPKTQPWPISANRRRSNVSSQGPKPTRSAAKPASPNTRTSRPTPASSRAAPGTTATVRPAPGARARIGGRPKPPTPNPSPKPGPSIEINPSIPIDPWRLLNPNQQQQPAPVIRDIEERAPRGGRPGLGPKPAPKPNTKPGTPGRPGIEFNPSIGIPIDPFQILNPGQQAPPAPVQRRARGGRIVAPKPGPKPGPKPAPKPPGGGPHFNPPTIGIEPIIPLPPFPPAPAPAAPTPTV